MENIKLQNQVYTDDEIVYTIKNQIKKSKATKNEKSLKDNMFHKSKIFRYFNGNPGSTWLTLLPI